MGGRGSTGGNNPSSGGGKAAVPEIRTVRGVEQIHFDNVGVVKIRPQYASSDKSKKNPIGYKLETTNGKSQATWKTKDKAIQAAVERWGKKSSKKK